MGSKLLAHRIPKRMRKTTTLTMSCDDYEKLSKILDEIGYELGRFREDLLAHQNKVRRTLLDTGRAEK